MRFGIAPVASCALCACTHAPALVSWHDVELGHRTCGPSAEIDVALDRSCTVVVRENREPDHRTALDRKRCEAIFDLAARRSHRATPACTVPQPFMAGVAITLDNNSVVRACWDDPLAAQLAALATEITPNWRRGDGMPQGCDVRAIFTPTPSP